LTIDGGGRLEVGHRIPGRGYRVIIGADEQTIAAESDSIAFDVPPGRQQVRITTTP